MLPQKNTPLSQPLIDGRQHPLGQGKAPGLIGRNRTQLGQSLMETMHQVQAQMTHLGRIMGDTKMVQKILGALQFRDTLQAHKPLHTASCGWVSSQDDWISR